MPKLKNVLKAEDQLNLLISLIGLINVSGEIHIDDAAAQLNVPRQVIRDAITTIIVSGSYKRDEAEHWFNVDWELFDSEEILAWAQNEGYDGAPRISVRQAAAIAAGLNFFKSLPEFAGSTDLDSLIELLKSSQPAGAAPSVKFQYGTTGADIELIRKALLSNRRISCNYTNQRGEQTDRDLDPIRLELQGAVWYLRAWCPKNEDVRPFRLDRMRNIQISEEERGPEALEAVEHENELDERLYIPGESDKDVLIEVDPEAFELIAEFAATTEPKTMPNGAKQITIKVGFLPNLGHLIVKYGGAARVIAPKEAREIVKNYALELLGEHAVQQEIAAE